MNTHPTDSHNTHGLAGNNQGLASNTHGLTGDNQGLAGNTHALAGNNHGLAGNNHGLTGNNQGLAGNTHGLAGNTHGLSGNSHSSGPAHGLAGHIHDAMCSGRDDDDSQVDSHTLGRPITTGGHTGAGMTSSTTTTAGAGHVLPGGAGAGIGHGSHEHSHGHGSSAAPLAGAAGVGAAAVGAHHDYKHDSDRSKLGHDHDGVGSGHNTFGRSGAGEGVPQSTTGHTAVDHDAGKPHKEGIFSRFDMTKDHTSTPAMVKGTTYGKHDVAPEDGVNLPDLPKEERKNLAAHEPELAAAGHTFAPAGKTGVDSQTTSHVGIHNAHPEAGLATAGTHGAGHDTRAAAPGHAGSLGATGAGLAGGDRDLARTHETHDLHNSNTAHRTTGEPEHKEGIMDKLKHAIGK